MLKSDGSESAIIDVAVAEIAGGEMRLIDFAHGKIEVLRIAVCHADVVQYGFRKICTKQFAGYKFHSEKGAFCQRNVG